MSDAALRRGAELRAIAQNYPRSATAHAELAQFYQSEGRSGEALEILDARIRQFPGAVWPLSIKAALLDSERRPHEALQVHWSIVALIPRVPVGWINLGHALRAVGQSHEAAEAFRRAIELEPSSGAAWWALATMDGLNLSEDRVALGEAILGCTNPIERVPLHFAMGRVFEKVSDFERAFAHYDAGNRLRSRLVPAQSSQIAEFVRKNEAWFSADASSPRGTASACPVPVFIVGMPRSGSSLVEQILASHPDIEGLGELPLLDEMAGAMGGIDAIASLAPTDLIALGQRYLDCAARFRKTDRPFFTDKLPGNWKWAGLIRRALPQARIVDVRREAVACCFANFAFYFNRQTNLAEGLRNLAEYYCAYEASIDRLRTLMPGALSIVSYEELIDDPEASVRSLLAFLDLPFDPVCLAYFLNERAVHTPSAEQVRRPIRHDANERRRAFEPWLTPLRIRLQQLR